MRYFSVLKLKFHSKARAANIETLGDYSQIQTIKVQFIFVNDKKKQKIVITRYKCHLACILDFKGSATNDNY
jgi:hypothetical protein